MSENIIKTIAKVKAERFRAAFETESEAIFFDSNNKLIHPGEFGIYREEVVKDFLRLFIPANRDISSGFVVTTSSDDISNQSDIIIYDAKHTPVIVDDKKQKFFPIETVCGVGEIKSNPNKREFKEAMQKLVKIKQLRTKCMHTPPIFRDPCLINSAVDFKETLFDQVYTFLICKSFNFNVDELINRECNFFSGIDLSYRPNIILSLKDGIFAYKDQNQKFLYYPRAINQDLPLMKGNFQENELVFGAYTFAAINSATIFHPDLVNYFL